MSEQPSRAGSVLRLRRIPISAFAVVLLLPCVLALAPVTPAAAQEPDPAVRGDAFRCSLEQATGIAQADAATAARLVCDELRRESQGRGAFELSLGTLGRLILLTASREDGELSVTVRLEALEELPVAAARVAKSLVHRETFASTARVDNLIESETRRPRTKRGSVKFTAGVADIEALGHGARASGFALGLVYSSSRFALPAEMRFAWDGAPYGEKELSLFSLSVGGRAFLSTRDTSPFLGAGMGVLHLSASEGGYYSGQGESYFYGERTGAAPYLEAGVEFLRTHRGRVALVVRADVPFSSLRSVDYVVTYGPRGEPLEQRNERDRYVLPLTIGLSVAF